MNNVYCAIDKFVSCCRPPLPSPIGSEETWTVQDIKDIEAGGQTIGARKANVNVDDLGTT